MSWTTETEQDKELKRLNITIREQSSALANEQTKCIHLMEEIGELKRDLKTECFRLVRETERGLKAELDLRIKTDAYSNISLQLDNAHTTEKTLRENLKDLKGETKRLEYQLEQATSSSSSSSFSTRTGTNGGGGAMGKLVEEKAGVEREVKILQLELKEVKESLSKALLVKPVNQFGFGGDERQKASNVNARMIAFENQIMTLQAENARLSLKAPKIATGRNSISPADASNRSRFGFAASTTTTTMTTKPRQSLLPDSAPNPARPASAMGSHIPAPTSRRRSSSFSAIPTTTNDKTKTTQLERDLAHSVARIEGFEVEITGLKTKLSTKDRELLKWENQIMALEKENRDVVANYKDKLVDAKNDLEELKRDLGRTKEEMKSEKEKALKDVYGEKGELEMRIKQIELEIGKKELIILKGESAREKLEQELRVSLENSLTVKTQGGRAIEVLCAEKAELERSLLGVRAELKIECGKERERERLATELDSTQRELAGLKEKHSRALDDLSAEKAMVERQLRDAAEDLKLETKKRTTSSANEGEQERLLAELVQVRLQLVDAQVVVKNLQAVDVVPMEKATAQIVKLEKQIVGLEQDVKESQEEIGRLEGVKQEMSELMQTTKASLAATTAELGALRITVSIKDDELEGLRIGLVQQLDSTTSSTNAREGLDAEIALVRVGLEAKGIELAAARAQLAAVESSHAQVLADLASELAAKEQQLADAADSLVHLVAAHEASTAQLVEELAVQGQAAELAATRLAAVDDLLAAQVADLACIVAAKEAEVLDLEAHLATTTSEQALALASMQEELVRVQRDHSIVAEHLSTSSIAHTVELAQAREALAFAERATMTLEEEMVVVLRERGTLLETVRVGEDKVDQLAAALDVLSGQIESVSGDKAAVEMAVVVLEAQLVELKTVVKVSLERVLELEAIVAMHSTRSYDDSEVELIHAGSIEAEETVTLLREELKTFEGLEWAAKEAKVEAGAAIAGLKEKRDLLEAQLQEMEEQSSEQRLRAEEEIVKLQEAVAVAEMTIQQLEGRLEVETSALKEIESLNGELEAAFVDMEASLQDAEQVRQTLVDTSLALETLQRSVEGDMDRLQHQLDVRDDSIRQLQQALESTLAVTIPLPPSPVAPTQPTCDAAQQSALVSRLREERDDLQAQLDFAKNEARFRQGSLADELTSIRAFAHADREALLEKVSAQSGELERRVLVDAEVQSSLVAIKASLDEARGERGAAEAMRQTEAEHYAAQQQQAMEECARLEQELVLRVSDTDVLRAQVAEAHLAIEELENLLESATTTNEVQLAHIQSLSTDLEAATEQVLELEDALAAAEQNFNATTHDATVYEDANSTHVRSDEAVLALEAEGDVLRATIEELKAKVLRRTEHIGLLEQSILVFTSRQQFSELGQSQKDDEDDTQELPARLDVVVAAKFEAELAAKTTMLAGEVQRREAVENELAEAGRRLEEFHALQVELSVARGTVQELEIRLDDASTSLVGKVEELQSARQESVTLRASLELAVEARATSLLEVGLLNEALAMARSDLATIQLSYDTLLSERSALVVTERHLVLEVDVLRSELSAQTSRVKELEREVMSKETDLHEAQHQYVDVLSTLEASGRTVSELESLLGAASADADVAKAAVETVNVTLVDTETRLGSSEQLVRHLETEIVRLEDAVQDLEAKLSKTTTDQDRGIAAVQAELLGIVAELEAKERATQTELDEVRVATAQKQDDMRDVLAATEDALRMARTELEQANERMQASEDRIHELRREVVDIEASLGAENSTLQTDVESLLSDVARLQDEREASSRQLVAANEDRATLQATLETSVARVVLLEQHIVALEQSSLDQTERLSSSLATAQAELAVAGDDLDQTRRSLEESEERVEQSGANLVALERQLAETQGAAARAQAQLQVSTAEVDRLLASVEGVAQEGEALRQERDSLEADLNTVLSDVEQLQEAQDAQLRSLAAATERGDLLDHERSIAASRSAELQHQIVDLEGAVELALASAAENSEAEARIKDLEKRLAAQSEDMEETEEKYLEVLRVQKRHLLQIEKLKVRASTYQTALAEFKAAQAASAATVLPTTTPVVTDLAPNPSGKKRDRPVEFDPTPAVPTPARAVVARTVPVAKIALAQENLEPRARAPVAVKLEPVKSSSYDGIVPLKPAAPTPIKRVPLAVSSANSGLAGAKATSASSLRERVEAMRVRARAAP